MKMAARQSWRHDISIWQDLAEEVARYMVLRKLRCARWKRRRRQSQPIIILKKNIKDILVEQGFSEVFSYPFLSQRMSI